MQNPLAGFAALHQLAAARGDGLHPRLLELAQRDARLREQGAIPLGVQAKSSGPASRNEGALPKGNNVTVLPTATQSKLSKNTG